MLPLLRQKFRNLYDTIRFLPKVTRRRIYLSTSLVTTMTTTGIYVGLQTTKIETFVNHLQMYRYVLYVIIQLIILIYSPNQSMKQNENAFSCE